MTTYDKLEKERIEKIKGLNPKELERYTNNLNNKIYESIFSGDVDNVDFYANKLIELLRLSDDESNLYNYSLDSRLSITENKMLEKWLENIIMEVFSNSKILGFINIILNRECHILSSTLLCYYHNYVKTAPFEVESLLIELNLNYGFDNDDFKEYAMSHFDTNNKMLMNSLDNMIAHSKESILLIIDMVDALISDNIENTKESLNEMIEDFKRNKDDIIKKSEKNKFYKSLKDGKVLDMNMALIEFYKMFDKTCELYLDLKQKALDLVNSDDGFAKFKEMDYNFSCEKLDEVVISKDDFIAMRPSYDVRNCKFKESTYWKDE